jgi:hypothetical protein
VKQHYGIRSEKLAEFGVKPFRGRKRAEKPEPTPTPTPVPSPPPKASMAPGGEPSATAEK